VGLRDGQPFILLDIDRLLETIVGG